MKKIVLVFLLGFLRLIAYSQENCFRIDWLGKEREKTIEYSEGDIWKITITREEESEFLALSDFYEILDHFKEGLMWKISDYMWIVYKDKYEITVQILDNCMTKVEIINTVVEERLIREK